MTTRLASVLFLFAVVAVAGRAAHADTLDLRAAAEHTERLDGAAWIPVAETVVVESASEELAVRFHPPAGHEQRVRYRLDGDALAPFGAWTTGRVELVLPVGDEATLDAFEIETRPAGTARTIAVHGYVKIKKLNSGG